MKVWEVDTSSSLNCPREKGDRDMKLHRTTLIKETLLFLLAAIVLTLCYPSKQTKFRYRYTLNQPWRYEEVLVAPYDFVVRKSPEVIQSEKNEIEKNKTLYYSLNSKTYIQQKNKLTEAFNEGKLPEAFLTHSQFMVYLMNKLEEVYEQGVFDEDLAVSMSDSTSIYVIGADNVAKKRSRDELLTPQVALSKILQDLPVGLDSVTVQQAGIKSFITPNIVYDEDKTDQMVEAEKASIEEIIGVVRKGAKIVGQGEEVTEEIYQELEGYRQAHEQMTTSFSERIWRKAGIGLLIFLLLITQLLYLVTFRPEISADLKNMLFIIAQIVFFVGLTYLVVPTAPNAVYVIPFCIVPILIRIFLDSRTAFTTHVLITVLSALVVPDQMLFILLQIAAGRTVVVTLKELTQRGNLIKATSWVFVTMVSVYTAYLLARDGSLNQFYPNILLYFAVNFVCLMFSFMLVYVFERLFGYVSNISLVELADINKPLLQRMSEVAPGTFQHSINVSILSAAACAKIGGDVQLVRSGALYHDIGKMRNPTYFTENQGPVNPHNSLNYDESARIIIRHVTDGVEMAESAHLPQAIIDFIRTHHGLGMTKYFYIKYKNEHPDQVIDESIFHYPGPNPFTREQGVMMLADSVEASSRSLSEITEESLKNHIGKIVDSIVEEGLLRNTPLTFRDIEVVKQVFLEKLRTMHHSRIAYPELNQRSAETADSKATDK